MASETLLSAGRASRTGEVFLETGGGAGVVEDGVGWWFSRTGFGWTLNMVSLSACALGWPYHHRAAEEQQQAARLQSGGRARGSGYGGASAREA
jgi:hypothetical protein